MQSAGLTAGVVQAVPSRRRAADAVDVAAAILGGVLGGAAALGSGLVVAALIIGIVVVAAVQLAFLSLTGRTLGLRVLNLRRVDNLTALPSTVLGAAEAALVPWRPRSVLTADLSRGRDPLAPVSSAASLAELHVASGAEPSPSERPLGRRAQGDSPHGLSPHDLGDVPPSAADSPRRSRHGARAATADATGTALASVRLLFDTGAELELSGSLLVGRNPETDARGTDVHALPDLSRSLSRTHVLLDWRDGLLWVTDLNTTNGSAIVDADGGYRPLVPGLKSAASPGWRVEIGRRTIQILPGAPA